MNIGKQIFKTGSSLTVPAALAFSFVSGCSNNVDVSVNSFGIDEATASRVDPADIARAGMLAYNGNPRATPRAMVNGAKKACDASGKTSVDFLVARKGFAAAVSDCYIDQNGVPIGVIAQAGVQNGRPVVGAGFTIPFNTANWVSPQTISTKSPEDITP